MAICGLCRMRYSMSMESATEEGTMGEGASTEQSSSEAHWTLLGVWGVWEYWLAPDGVNVYRRRAKLYGRDTTGAPMGVRWESTLAHFTTYVAGRLAV